MDKGANSQSSGINQKLCCLFCSKLHIDIDKDACNAFTQKKKVISVGVTLELIMLHLLWQPLSLQNIILVHPTLCWQSHNLCNAYQMHSIIILTVKWLVS